MKFIQIACSPLGLYALSEDGVAWEWSKQDGWIALAFGTNEVVTPVPPPSHCENPNVECLCGTSASSRGSAVGEALMKLWNETLLCKFTVWTKERKTKLAERLKNPHFYAHWPEAIRRLSGSKFATGKVIVHGRCWRASIDWFLANDNNYVKALEGRYDDGEKDPFSQI